MAYTESQITALKATLGEEKVAELLAAQGSGDNGGEGDNGEGDKGSSSQVTPPAPSEPAKPGSEKSEEPQINDDVVLQFLKSKGIDATSIEDLKKPTNTQADPAKTAEEREAAKLAFGLQKGRFTRKEYESFVTDTNDPKALVYNDFYKTAKEDDPELSDEEILAEFNEEYALEAENGSRKFKNGVKKLAIVADRMLKEKYGKIYATDGEFDSHEAAAQQQSEVNKRILAATPVYKKDVEDVFGELKKVSTKFSDGAEYEISVLEDSLSTIKAKYLEEGSALRNIEDGYTKEDLKAAAWRDFVTTNFAILAEEVAKQHLLKHQKGTKGIIPASQTQRSAGSNLTERQEQAIKAIKPDYEPIAN